jgi:hypothetical protein
VADFWPREVAWAAPSHVDFTAIPQPPGGTDTSGRLVEDRLIGSFCLASLLGEIMHQCRTAVLCSIVTVAAILSATSAARAINGPGALYVAGATHTSTHWNIQVGVPTIAEIRSVGSEVGTPKPATITVLIKNSQFGNTTLTATRIGSTSNYTFTYKSPVNACNTTIVAYVIDGQNASNDLLDDGLMNNSGTSAAGFRFVDANGRPIDCTGVGTTPSAWGGVKTLFQ